MFGRTGNIATSRDFIIAVKNELTGINNLPGFWSQFKEFITYYSMPSAKSDSAGRFQLLISTRCRGKPEFFVLDSYTRSLEIVKSPWISLGSGKSLLDPIIERDYAERIRQITEAIQDYPLPNYIQSYFVCLWLSELALTFEKSILEKNGVGGAFHFTFQNTQLESVQEPALYVFCDVNLASQRVTCWFYRVCFVEGCLVIEQVIPPNQIPDAPEGKHERFASCDEAARPDIVEQLTNDPTFHKKMKRQLNAQPFYRFCGFGFTNPLYRKGFGFHFTTEGDYVVTPDGQISEEYKSLIISNFQ
jgi:hypothetical protein